jgi:hypothetical protein
LEFFRVLEEFDQFRHFLLGFLDTGNVLESDFVAFLVQHAGAALAEAQGAFAGHLDLADDEEVDDAENEGDGQQLVEQTDHEVVAFGGLE